MLPRVNLVRTEGADFLLFSTNDAISRAIVANGSWDPALITICRMFYENEPAPLILDVGANLGAFAVPVAREIAAAGGMVYSYEPQRIIYYQLCGNAFLNRLDNLHAFNMAIGDHDGHIAIPAIDYSQSKNIGGFSLDAQSNELRDPVAIHSNAQPNVVPIAKLDSLKFPKPPALIKIDVEGLELKVLQGAVNLLEQSGFPPLFMEAWNQDWFREQKAELLAFLSALGYEYFQILDDIVAQHPGFPRQLKFVVAEGGGIQIIRTR